MTQSTSPISLQHGTIGFIGLGWMGYNFAARLLGAGWS
jgi:phosphoglycerate dehydrogenase-like enzyme